MTTPSSRLLLGHTKPTERTNSTAVHDEGEGHLVTIAPTGAGKGVSALIPALLSWSGPAVVIDPKGEAFHVTARRRLELGQQVYLLDPFGVTDADTDSLNPLDLIQPGSANAADDAAMLANLLSAGVEFTKDPFWDDRARSIITGILVDLTHENLSGREATLGDARAMLAVSHLELSIVADRFKTSPHPEVQAAAATLANEHRVLSSIMATAHSHMSFLRGGPVQDSLATSTVPLSDITDGTPLTLYLVLPPDKLVSHGRLLRLWLGVVLSLFGRRKVIPPQPTLLLVDEAAQLGHLEPLLTAITLLRGYGVKVWSFWQDLAQLKTLYPDSWATLLNNCQVQQFFAPASPHAAAEIEDYLAGSSPVAVAGLNANDVLISRKGRRPRVLRRADYRRDVEFMGRFEPNPFYRHRRPHGDPLPQSFGDNVLSFPKRKPSSDPGCTL